MGGKESEIGYDSALLGACRHNRDEKMIGMAHIAGKNGDSDSYPFPFTITL